MDKITELLSVLHAAEQAPDRRLIATLSSENEIAISNLKSSIGRIAWAIEVAQGAATELLRVQHHFEEMLNKKQSGL